MSAPSCIPEVLSPSSLNAFSECEAKWYYRKVLQLPEERGAALGLGTAVHEALAENFRQKIETFEDLPVEGVQTIFRDAMSQQLDELVLSPEEDADELVSCGETLVRCYMDQAAPAIHPAAVELHVEGNIGGVPVHGYIDLMDTDGNIIDIKTAGKKPSGFPANHRLQVTTYVMLAAGASGIARLDTLTKTKTVALHSQTVEIGALDVQLAERLYSITMDQMQSGLIKPNRNSNMCSRKYCAFADQCCKDYGGEVK